MRDIARATAGISLPAVFLIIALGCSGSPLPPPPLSGDNTPPTATPAPPFSMTYRMSSLVTDDKGSPFANAPLTLYYDNSFKSIETSTDARGHYSSVFESGQRTYDGNANVVGAIFYTGGGDYENYHVQALPFGTADIVKNLRLRRALRVNAGQSIVVSIDPDSSLAYDGEDFMRMDWVSERFHVRVADAGTLRITARPLSGGIVPQIGVFCVYAADNCESEGVTAPPGIAARRVKANSLFQIRLQIPSQMAPRRYDVTTSLE